MAAVEVSGVQPYNIAVIYRVALEILSNKIAIRRRAIQNNSPREKKLS